MAFDAIVLAAGAGDRFGGPTPKQWELLAGIPIVVRAVGAAVSGGAERVALVVAADRLDAATALIDGVAPGVLRIVAGGPTRVDSTRLGLAGLGDGPDVVVVHDAARPLAPPQLFERVVAAVRDGADAATAAVPTADTIGRVVAGDLIEVLERAQLARVQTPQGFRRQVLTEAHRRASAANDTTATDDCGLVLRHLPGARIACVPGDEGNLKITTRADMLVADLLLRRT